MIKETFCSNTICTTAIWTDTDGRHDLRKQIVRKNEVYVSLHPLQVKMKMNAMAAWLPTSKNGVKVDARV